MNFGDTLLATLGGSLSGAVGGAFAAWLFSLDLRRRETEASHRTRLDAKVADVVRLLGEVYGAGQAFAFALSVGSHAIYAPPPHLARQQLLSATLAARMAAGDEEGPLLALYEVVTTKNDDAENRAEIDYTHAAHVLIRWRKGALTDTEAQEQITAGSPPLSRPED